MSNTIKKESERLENYTLFIMYISLAKPTITLFILAIIISFVNETLILTKEDFFMDKKAQMINDLLLNIAKVVDNKDMEYIKNSIHSVMRNYDVVEKSTEVGFYTGDTNRKIIETFKLFKRIEGKSEKTLVKYEFDLCKLFEFLNKDYNRIDVNDIRYFMATYQNQSDKRLSGTTMDNMRKTFSSFYNWCRKEGYIDRSPMDSFGIIKRDTVPKPAFTVEEMEIILASADNIRDRTLLYFLQATGLRVGEASKINLSDIDWINRTVTVRLGKGGYSSRVVPLNDRIVYMLKQYMVWRSDNNVTCDALFVGKKGNNKPISNACIEQMVRETGKRANVLNAHPHRYRTTFITNLLARGMKLEEVQILAGHKDIQTTVSYNRCNLTDIKNKFIRVA